MNDLPKEDIFTGITLCQKCGKKLNDIGAIFWNNDMTKIIEQRVSCSDRFCDFVLVNKYELLQ